MTRVIEAVVIGCHPVWGKWPSTVDTRFDDVLSVRHDTSYAVHGNQTTLRLRWYPAYLPYVTAGVASLPVPYPAINNTVLPPQPVLDAMLSDLSRMSQEGVSMCYWEHAYQCYPPVAQHLKRLFKHSILIHGDDCPGSTEVKTAPIAQYFDSVFHGNLIWAPNGETTKNLYARMGVQDAHYIAMCMTGGLLDGIEKWESTGVCPPDTSTDAVIRYGLLRVPPKSNLNMERRIAQLRARHYSYDLAFVGACAGVYRQQLDSPEFATYCQNAGIRARIAGTGMRAGQLQPCDLSALARVVAKLYLDSFSVVNRQMISLAASRMFDAWGTGSLLLQYDPFGEMGMIGVKPNVHYAAYDGTLTDLIARIKYYQAHLDEAEAIIRAGHTRGAEVSDEYNMITATQRVLDVNAGKLGLV